ncbi:MAG: type II secretion system protein GspE, partial [Planctomycetes bacterium]|nr:type II secretion system protein GspE [Planctomycetota bacterium]
MVNIAKLTKKRLGELLIAEGLIHNDQVQEALAEQQKNGLLLGEALIKLGYVTELDIAGALSTQFGLPYIDASRYTISIDLFKAMPVEFWGKNQIVPLDKIGDIITFAVAGPLSETVFK